MCSQLLLELLQGQGAARLPVQRCGAGCVPVATEKCWQLCACVKLGGITDLSLSAVAADGTPQMAQDASVLAAESVCSLCAPHGSTEACVLACGDWGVIQLRQG